MRTSGHETSPPLPTTIQGDTELDIHARLNPQGPPEQRSDEAEDTIRIPAQRNSLAEEAYNQRQVELHERFAQPEDQTRFHRASRAVLKQVLAANATAEGILGLPEEFSKETKDIKYPRNYGYLEELKAQANREVAIRQAKSDAARERRAAARQAKAAAARAAHLTNSPVFTNVEGLGGTVDPTKSEETQVVTVKATKPAEKQLDPATEAAKVEALRKKYHDMTETEIMNLTERAFNGEMPQDEFDAWSKEYRDTIEWIKKTYGDMEDAKLIGTFERDIEHAEKTGLSKAYFDVLRPYYEAAKQREAQRLQAEQQATHQRPEHIDKPTLTPEEQMTQWDEEELRGFDPSVRIHPTKYQIQDMNDLELAAMIDYVEGPARYRKLEAERTKLNKKLNRGFLGFKDESIHKKIATIKGRLAEIDQEMQGIANPNNNTTTAVERSALRRERQKRQMAREAVEGKVKDLFGYVATKKVGTRTVVNKKGKKKTIEEVKWDVDDDLRYKYILGIGPDQGHLKKNPNKILDPKRMNYYEKLAFDEMVLRNLRPEVVFADPTTKVLAHHRLGTDWGRSKFRNLEELYEPAYRQQPETAQAA